jgi:uncharacterized membrane protein YfhO
MKTEKKQFLTHIVLLFLFTVLLLLLPMGTGRFWGTDGDWYSQHTAVADSLRQTMLEQGSLLPQYISLGGGSSIYDFSYYGLLRPDVLLSCLLPQVDMKYIVSGYLFLCVTASVWLCYFWMKRYGLTSRFSFWGALLFATSTAFYQAHHQIMFVNYMPFLLLALLGVERVLEKKKWGMLCVSLFFIYLHSFYYSIACLFVVGVYSLHRMFAKKELVFGRLLLAVFLSVGMAMVFLLPTGLDILSTSKDGGSFAAEQISAVSMSLESLLYSPYGCGMTLLVLYCLLLSFKRKGSRFLSMVLLAVLCCPAVWLILNGFLYARAKILIPCVPLLVLAATETLEAVAFRKQRLEFWPVLVCLLPVFCGELKVLAALDALCIGLWVLLGRFKGDRHRRRAWYLATLLVPGLVSLGVHAGAPYLEAADCRQEPLDMEQVELLAGEEAYRFENIANNFVTSNCLPAGDVNRASMYSSVTNDRYGEFFYNTMGNAISANNRVALVPGQNPCFNYFMGIRYLLMRENQQVPGYEPIYRQGDYVLAENKNVLPVCYGTTELMEQESFEKLTFPENMAALGSRAVVENDMIRDENGGGETKTSDIFSKQEPEEFFAPSADYTALKEGKAEGNICLPLKKTLSNQLLVIRFQVDNPKGSAVEITINGVKNKLSADSAPYPNENYEFTYVWNTGEDLKELEVRVKGVYSLKDMEIYTADAKRFGHKDVVVPQSTSFGEKNANVYRGTIEMKKDGYFVTSFPYREGYEVLVDGKAAEPRLVNTAFVGFPLEKGMHSISISYEAPGYRAGLFVSLGSWTLLAGACVLKAAGKYAERRRSQMWKNKESEVVVWEYL